MSLIIALLVASNYGVPAVEVGDVELVSLNEAVHIGLVQARTALDMVEGRHEPATANDFTSFSEALNAPHRVTRQAGRIVREHRAR